MLAPSPSPTEALNQQLLGSFPCSLSLSDLPEDLPCSPQKPQLFNPDHFILSWYVEAIVSLHIRTKFWVGIHLLLQVPVRQQIVWKEETPEAPQG